MEQTDALRKAQGLPDLPRDLDPAVRTCGACFRDIKATSGYGTRSAPYHNKIVDHGYTIRSGWRQGSCWGVGRLPLEESKEALEMALKGHEEYRKRRGVPRLRLLRKAAAGDPGAAKKVGTLVTYTKRHKGYGRYEDVPTSHSVGSREWGSALRGHLRKAELELRGLWDGSFASIPWYRAARREWAPQAPDVVPAKGAPWVTIQKGDYRGKPSLLSTD